MRESGILMPLSSLPSSYGIGELGAETLSFVENLKETGITIWQLLPLNPLGYGNSPYQPYSSCAGDEIYISLEELYRQGLIEKLPEEFQAMEKRVDYEKVRAFKEPYLREAYSRFEKTEAYEAFISQDWVYDYGMFRALKKKNGGNCWNQWEEEDKNWPMTREERSEEIQDEVNYHMVLQYLFFSQWMKIKSYANEKGIRIMGDVPFYVGVDSVDVWGARENFLLDAEGKPVFIAGVPPDYFSATGQRWGNPIYDWEYLKEKNYQFWLDRIGYNSQLFDLIRIDHFRAFDTYWKIPAFCPTAVDGEWVEAPGYEVLALLQEKLPDVELVAEDLGDLRPEVVELKEHFHLKGMKVLEFSIDTSGKYARDAFGEEENMIIYTGTHDNDTLMQWYESLSVAGRRKVRSFLKRQGISTGSVRERLLTYTLNSKAAYAIVPMADVLGLGKEGRMNLPGTVGSPNWEWRMPDQNRIRKGLVQYRKLIEGRK